MSVLSVVVVRADEWEGVYVNGELRYENHTVLVCDLPQQHPISLTIIDSTPALEDYVMEESGYPKTLAEARLLLKGK